MKRRFYSIMLRSLMGAAMVATCSDAVAEGWEQIRELPNAYTHFITSTGRFLMSDLDLSRKGGISYSDDKGATWTQCEVKDYNYKNFYEADGYIYALGSMEARIARSSDDGETWEMLNYSNAIKDIVPDKALPSAEASGIVKIGDVLYIGDFVGAGVLMSTDNGETWKVTDRESLMISMQGSDEKFVDCIYHMTDFKGVPYAFGMFVVARYDADADKWEILPQSSNFMTCSIVRGGRLIIGRSTDNSYQSEYNPVPYLHVTEDGYNWGGIMAPPAQTPYGTNLNVRAMTADEKNIYTAGPGWTSYGGPEFFYTENEGEDWKFVGGLPDYHFPLTLACDDKYIYTALYAESPTVKTSGLWRLAKSDLNGAGINTVAVDESGLAVNIDNQTLSISTEGNIRIFDISGRAVVTVADAASVDLSALPGGIFLYEVNADGTTVTGKFAR